MRGLSSISAKEMALLAFLIAMLADKFLDIDGLNSVGNFAVGMGGIMLILAAQGEYVKSQKEEEADKVQKLERQVEDLECQVIQLIQGKKELLR
jgi:hypothetical protein